MSILWAFAFLVYIIDCKAAFLYTQSVSVVSSIHFRYLYIRKGKSVLKYYWIIARTWYLSESIRKPKKGCAFQESTRSVPAILVLWITWAPSLRINVKSGLFDYRYNMIACHSVTEGYKRTGNGWCTWGQKMIDHLTHVCFSVLMLCDWLSLISHFPTLERTIKPLSEELIERVIQIAHIWGSKRGEVTKTISFVQAFSSLSTWMTS